jgi:hypothetical protein
MMTALTPTEYAAFVGRDGADRQHDVCRQPAGGDTREFSVLPHRPEPMAQWALGRQQRFEGRPSAVGLEWRQGPLVCALQPYAFLVLCAVHPATLAKSRDAFCLSHAKDAPTAAALGLARLMTRRDKRTARQPPSPARRAWPRLVEQRRALEADKVRRTHRRTAALTPYVPQLLEWWKDKDPGGFGDVLPRGPTRKHAPRARKARLSACCHAYHGRYPHRIEDRLQAILQATPLTSDAGVSAPERLLVEVLVQP